MREVKFGKNRFYIGDEIGSLAEITFVPTGDDILIIDHTFVGDELGGEGFGKVLVNEVASYARENNKKIIPLCPFAKRVMEKDSQFQDILK